jgi:hypothetical protein
MAEVLTRAGEPDRAVTTQLAAVSDASHLQGHELSSTASKLRDWIEAVRRFLDQAGTWT